MTNRTLYDFQETAVKFHLGHHYCINASEMGLGKSLMALETARRCGGKVVVFGPAFLQGSWESEAKKENISIKYVAYSQIHKTNSKTLLDYDFWIADEVHFCKNPKAQRTHKFYALLKELRPKRFIGLTGTPIKNRIPDLWTLIGFCEQNPLGTSGKKLEGDLRHYYKFSNHFCHVEKLKFGNKQFTKFGGVREDRIPELKSLLTDKYIRFEVKHVLKSLPEVVYKDVELSLDPEPELAALFEAYMTGRKLDPTAKRVSALLKTSSTIQYIKDMQESDCGPVLVFTDHVESAKALAGGLSKSALVTGATLVSGRHQIVTDFQLGKYNVLVATIGALSVGVTLTAARHVVFNDLSWTPSDNQQAEKRIHRIGQDKVCFCHYIISSPTDLHIKKTLVSKLETIGKVIG